MKNGIVFYQDGTKKVISAENDKFMALIRENIRFDNNDIVIESDLPSNVDNYIFIYNDEDFFNSDIIHKNKSVSRMLDTYAPIFGNAVLVKVVNDFSCGSIDEIVEMTTEEIVKFMRLAWKYIKFKIIR